MLLYETMPDLSVEVMATKIIREVVSNTGLHYCVDSLQIDKKLFEQVMSNPRENEKLIRDFFEVFFVEPTSYTQLNIGRPKKVIKKKKCLKCNALFNTNSNYWHCDYCRRYRNPDKISEGDISNIVLNG